MALTYRCIGLVLTAAALVGNLAWSQLSLRWMYLSDYAQRHDFGRAVQVDRAGNVYTTGFSRSAAGDYDIFVLKLSPEGTPFGMRATLVLLEGTIKQTIWFWTRVGGGSMSQAFLLASPPTTTLCSPTQWKQESFCGSAATRISGRIRCRLEE